MENAKNQARRRITALLDTDSFVEIGKYILGERTEYNHPSDNEGDGVITGYGLVSGKLVYVFSQDASCLGGSIGKMHGKKINQVYDLALKSKSPVIGFIDCGGIRLSEGLDAMDALGGLFMKQTFASGMIPQIMGVFGACGGGLSFMHSLVDFTFLEESAGNLFVHSPAVVKNNKDFTSYPMNEQADGTGDEGEVINKIRELVTVLPASNKEEAETLETQDDLNRLIPYVEELKGEGRELASAISDDNFFIEVKELRARELVTGFIKLDGITTGIITLCGGELNAKACEKAKEFVSFLNAFDIPLVTLTNVEGFITTKEEETVVGKAAGLLAKVLIHSNIPKINVIIGNGLGSGYMIFNSKHIGADMVLAWEDSKVGLIASEHAAKVLSKEETAKELIAAKTSYEEFQNNIKYAAGKGYIDDIIRPQETRQRIIAALLMLYYKEESRPVKKHIIQ